MGGGASSTASAKYQEAQLTAELEKEFSSKSGSSGTGTANSPFQSSPLDGIKAARGQSKGAGGEKVMSDAKLRKIALGLPGYHDVDRDYEETRQELRFNKTTQETWSAPAEGASTLKPERLFDGNMYSTKQSATQPAMDPRALARKHQVS